MPEERKEKFLKLYNEGFTYEEIGDKFGITRQRVHQIITGYESPKKSKSIDSLEDVNKNEFKLSVGEVIKKIEKRFDGGMEEYLKKKAFWNNARHPIFKIIDEIDTLNISSITGLNSDARNRYRELIRMRDEYTCQLCGREWQEGERRYDVHHIGGDANDTKEVEIEPEEVITLCHKCHLNLEHKLDKKST